MKGKRRKVFSKVIAVLMAVAFAFTLVPASPAKAAEGDGETTNSGIVLSKTATLEDDGTYTINLEAYATGEVSTSSTVSPTDIVLVLDLSGSMSNSIGGYIELESKGYSYRAIGSGTYYYLYDGDYYEVNRDSYGSWNNKKYYLYFEIGGETYYLTANGVTTSLASAATSTDKDSILYTGVLYQEDTSVSRISALKTAVNSFIDATAEKNVNVDENEQHRISLVKFAGDKKDSIGNDTDGSGYNNTQIVQELTPVSGDNVAGLKAKVEELEENGATAADYGLDKAEEALANSDENRAKVVILFTDGEPNHYNGFDARVAASAVNKANTIKRNNTTIYTISVLKGSNPADTTGDMNKYMNAVSSNYPAASATSTSASNWSVSLGEGGNNGYYKVADSADSLTEIFKEISNSVGSTTVTLDGNAVLKDIISTEFTLPDGFSASGNITVQTVNYEGKGVFSPIRETLNEAEVSVTGEEINVSGFSYKDNYVIDGSGDGKVETSGKKLIVTIRGVEATDSAATGSEVSTNASTSGIYENASAAEPTAVFEQPKTIIGNKTYVLDYAKSTNLTDLGLSASHLDGDGLNKFNTPVSDVTETYGKVSASNGTVNYTPTTTNWDGYDSFYTFGKNTSDAYAWSKVSVLPANNVYYEDTFETDEAAGTVGIVYSGDWNIVGKSVNNTETANNATHGWVESMADDAAYSDGSAHQTSTDNATATFTFTGTGVDIYSRTDLEVGKVRGQLYKGGNTTDASMLSKVLMVDNLSESGTYYQIPTLSFQDLEYGTYTVKLTVGSMSSSTSANGKRSTYYLDGIRVYNPIKDKEDDNTVKNAYGDAELNAKFTEVRDMLLEAGSFVDSDVEAEGFVFIDEVDGTTGVKSNVIGTYEDYGPKNEVYLAAGQSIAFKVDGNSGNYYYLGLKAPNGATTVQFTNGEGTSSKEINAASDLYYNVTPNSNGIILVKNTGDKLLSITKLRTTGITASGSGLMSLRSVELLSYADEFDSLPVVAYSNEAVSEEPDAENPGEGTEVENPEEGIGADESGDVIIDNPQPEEKPEEKPVINTPDWLNKIFNVIRGWFGRR